ncbi:MAG: metallophosphoesterase [Desulfonatronovibrio sp.]
MSILFMGDPHGDFQPAIRKAEEFRPEALILLGDQQPEASLDRIVRDISCPVWWILGNHDSDQPHYLKNHFSHWDFNLGNRVVEIAGIRIAGLGGEFRQEVWHPWDGEGRPKWNRRQDYLTSLAPDQGLEGPFPDNCFQKGLP